MKPTKAPSLRSLAFVALALGASLVPLGCKEEGTQAPTMEEPAKHPEVQPHAEAIVRSSDPEAEAEAELKGLRRPRVTSAGMLTDNTLSITNNEARPLPIGIPRTSRTSVVPPRRTVLLTGVNLIWIGTKDNVWRVRGKTRYLAYDKQGQLSLAEWEPK